MTQIYLFTAGLILLSRVACMQIGLLDSVKNNTVALVDLEGDLHFDPIYVNTSDMPGQYAALQKRYSATGGQYWSALFQQDGLKELQTASITADTGVEFLNFTNFVQLLTFKVPWFTPGVSYCHWWGVTCCLTSSELVLSRCTQGFQSVSELTLSGANMTGKVPSDLFASLPDVSIANLDNNPGLTGAFDNVTAEQAAGFLYMHLADTSVQYACASPGTHGKTALYNSSCFPNFLMPSSSKRIFPATRPGMSCPGVQISVSLAVYDGATVDPVLYSYQGCNCVSGFLPHYSVDSVGLFQMACGLPPGQSFWLWVGPVVAVVISLLALSWLLLAYGTRMQNDWNILRTNRLKRRHPPGTLMGSTGKGMELFQSDMSLVMTDVEGSTALWEWNSYIMNIALGLHDHTLRALLPQFFGYEVTTEGDAFIVAFHNPMDAVSWALHVQLALLQLAWPAELLQHPLAKQEVGSDGNLLFKGLRVRMAINTGVPVDVIVHNVTKQVEYRGELVEVTESLSHLPSGGQVLLSHTTYRGICQHAQDIKLPSPTAKVSNPVLDWRLPGELVRHVTSSSATSATGLLGSRWGHTPSASPRAARANVASFSWLQLRRGASMSSASTNAGAAVACQTGSDPGSGMDAPPTPRSQSARLQQFSFVTASCAMIDMGSYMLSECRNRPYTVQDAAQPAISGEHVVQILPHSLLERANTFCAIDSVRQVAPSYFDAPGVLSAHSDVNSPVCVQGHHTRVAFAVVSVSGYQEWLQMDKQVAMIALGRFESCVRSTLLLCAGYECCEKDGMFTAAFPSPRAALQWALTLQLALLKLPWGEELLSLAPTAEEYGPISSQVLFRGLSARLGIACGPVLQPRPNLQTGRAEYAGSAPDQAATLCAMSRPGQILMEYSSVEVVRLDWAQVQPDSSQAKQIAGHIALRNYALLVHHLESEVAASQLRASTSSLSGIVGRELSQSTKRTSTMPMYMQNFVRNLALDMSTLPDLMLEDEGALSDAPLRHQHSLQPTRHSMEGIAALPTWDAQMAAKAKFIGETSTESRQWPVALQHIPCLPIGVEVYLTDQATSKASQDRHKVCQVFPARLSERRSRHGISSHKGLSMAQNTTLVLAKDVMLPTVVHLPLAAEPPLYIDVLGTDR